MNIPVRLYRLQDMDLILLYLDRSRNFNSEVRNVIIAYAQGKEYTIPVFDTPSDYKEYLQFSVMTRITFDDREYPEIKKLLSRLKYRQRGSFIKALIRRSMTEIPLAGYFTGDDMVMNKKEAVKKEREERRLSSSVKTGRGSLKKMESTGKQSPATKKNQPLQNKTESLKPHPVTNNKTSNITLLNPLAGGLKKASPADMYVPDEDIPLASGMSGRTAVTSNYSKDNGESSGMEFDIWAEFDKLAH